MLITPPVTLNVWTILKDARGERGKKSFLWRHGSDHHQPDVV
jgi:hypothetical protein